MNVKHVHSLSKEAKYKQLKWNIWGVSRELQQATEFVVNEKNSGLVQERLEINTRTTGD